jgi:sugar/nucleoside kinase (ribokinase family)
MKLDAVVFGNITLDVICKTVDDVPRHESLVFDQVAVMPGGCGSNVAIGLSALGVSTALVACMGSDDAAGLVRKFWERFNIDLRYVRVVEGQTTGTSVGLVDSDAQPRFIHTSGANRYLTSDALDLPALAAEGARALHIAGYFVLPGIQDGAFPQALARAQKLGLITSLDVVRSKRMDDPAALWPCLPFLEIFLCNAHEAWRLTGEEDPMQAGRLLCARGARAAIIKLGRDGCWLETAHHSGRIDAPAVEILDTTGAGDAFAAGLIHAILQGQNLPDACRAGNAAGARMVGSLGAIGGWITDGR